MLLKTPREPVTAARQFNVYLREQSCINDSGDSDHNSGGEQGLDGMDSSEVEVSSMMLRKATTS